MPRKKAQFWHKNQDKLKAFFVHWRSFFWEQFKAFVHRRLREQPPEFLPDSPDIARGPGETLRRAKNCKMSDERF
jgi:hypothetical protein